MKGDSEEYKIDTNLKILIMDANPSILSRLQATVNRLGLKSCSTSGPDVPMDQINALRPDLAILGPSLSYESCLKCIQKLKIIDLSLPILVSSNNGYLSEGSFSASFHGIHRVGPQPKQDDIARAIEKALVHKLESDKRPDYQVIIGQSEEIKKIRQQIHRVSDKDITVLITGESGTGKELIARSIHYHSPRYKGPLVKINCGSLPDSLLESEVFGFQQGAFTGAHRNKPGRIELAHGGTLLIDEVGNLSLSLQVKFLQALEDKAFSRLGDTHDKIVDVRIIAATNADLYKKVREGTFRKDLFYRLNVMHIEAPPLRNRKDDLPWFTHYFLNKYCFELKKKPLHIPDQVAQHFQAYQWPGNLREFENVIRRAIVMRSWSFIFEDLDLESGLQKDKGRSLTDDKSPNFHWGNDKVRLFFEEEDFSLKKMCKAYVSQVESHAILKALKKTHWQRKKAAECLQVSYKTLLNRIMEFDLKP